MHFNKKKLKLSALFGQAVRDGYKLICLSDRATGPARVPVDSLLAVGYTPPQKPTLSRVNSN